MPQAGHRRRREGESILPYHATTTPYSLARIPPPLCRARSDSKGFHTVLWEGAAWGSVHDLTMHAACYLLTLLLTVSARLLVACSTLAHMPWPRAYGFWGSWGRACIFSSGAWVAVCLCGGIDHDRGRYQLRIDLGAPGGRFRCTMSGSRCAS